MHYSTLLLYKQMNKAQQLFSTVSSSDPCQDVTQAPEDSVDCRAAGVQTWRSRSRGRSHFYTSASDARFHTPALCGGAL